MHPHLKRREMKFQMHCQEAEVLRSKLAALMEPDPYSGSGGYFIRSLYFDNLFNMSFYEKVEGFENRKKFRLRLYEFEAERVKFEIKQKMNDVIVKHSAWIGIEDALALEKGDYECLLLYNDPTLSKIYSAFKRHHYRPVVLVDYHRTAFYLNYNQIRVTLDRNLQKSSEIEEWRNPHLTTIPVLQKNYVILEIKYNDFFPQWLSKMINTTRLNRCATSKYCLSRLI